MAILPYCIFSCDVKVELRSTGVRTADLELACSDELKAIYSEHVELGNLTKDDALAFHEVIYGIFSQVVVIPFRFPTLLDSRAELEEHLAANAQAYVEDLQLFRDFVQMELVIAGVHTANRRQARTFISGADFLRTRSQNMSLLRGAAQTAHRVLDENVADWRENEPTFNNSKGEIVRCFALVERAKLPAFCQQLRESVSLGSSISQSGPWPPTAFMKSMTKAPA